MKHITHVKYIIPADRYINQLPHYSVFGRKTTLRINPDYIPDLHWKLTNTYHTTNIGHAEMLHTIVSIYHITVDTLRYARSGTCRKWCGTSLNTKTTTSQSKQELTICFIIPIT